MRPVGVGALSSVNWYSVGTRCCSTLLFGVGIGIRSSARGYSVNTRCCSPLLLSVGIGVRSGSKGYRVGSRCWSSLPLSVGVVVRSRSRSSTGTCRHLHTDQYRYRYVSHAERRGACQAYKQESSDLWICSCMLKFLRPAYSRIRFNTCRILMQDPACLHVQVGSYSCSY